MPLVEDKNQQVAFARSIGQPDFEPETQDFNELALAAFRTENSIGSYIVRNNGLPDDVINNESFNPWDHITEDEKLNENFTSHITLADTVEEIEAVRKQSAREQKDRQALSEGGANSFLAQMAIGAIDPINLIPVGGTAYKTYKTGSSILKAAAVTAGVASGTQAAVEMSLHHTQLERTYGESALNIGTTTILGGFIGATPPMLKKLFKKDTNKEILDSMDPEPKIARGENSIFQSLDIEDIKSKLLIEAREEVTPVAGNKLTRGELKNLKSEKEQLEISLSRIEETTPAEVQAEIEGAKIGKKKSARKIKAEAKAEAEKITLESRQVFQEKLDIVLSKIESNEIASKAESDLSRIEQGILPEEFQATLDKLKQEQDQIKTDEPILTEEVRETTSSIGRSVGAAAVDRDIQVQGKIARALTKALGFDPLSRSLTSQEPLTRNLAVELAENPIAMENRAGTFTAASVETSAKIKDGRYYEAVEGHLSAFKEYRKNGGTLKRREFNEQVSKEMRNPTTADPHIKKSADEWRSKLYDPLKKEMIENDLLPKDVEVSTAVSYLNRSWNKQKIRGNLDNFVNVVSTWLKDKEGATGPASNFDALSREIATRITSTPDGRLPYDYKIAENSQKGGRKKGVSGITKERSFTIPDELIEDFLENDIERLGGRYLQSLAVDIELVKRFGDVNMTKEIKEISEAWDVKIQSASKTSKKEAIKLAKQKDTDIESIAAMRDRMRGVFGQVDSDDFWVRARRTARDLNYLRFMGGVTASSIPDIARIVMSNGIVSTFKNGLSPLINNNKAFKISAAEAKKYGVGTDILIGGRSELIADVADYSQGGTAFERGIRSAAEKFGKVNLMDRWTASVKQLHAVVAQTDMANIMVAGKYDKRLGQLGINEPISRDIAKQLRKFGKKDDGVWIANTRLWDDQELAEIWGGALRKESDRVIVVPGQEKPLFMSTDMGKTFLQFRSFMFSATQRMLIAGIQGQDAHFMQGLTGITSLGMMAYAFKQWDAGRDLSDDPAVWVTEGIDRSGITGIIMEMNNTIEKVSNNNFGLRPLLGISTPSSRFASRSQSEAFLGPTFGSMLSTVLKVSGGTADGDLAESDIRAIRRLLPYQNLMIFRQLIDKIESEIN